jgi:hypothetical protein
VTDEQQEQAMTDAELTELDAEITDDLGVLRKMREDVDAFERALLGKVRRYRHELSRRSATIHELRPSGWGQR